MKISNEWKDYECIDAGNAVAINPPEQEEVVMTNFIR